MLKGVTYKKIAKNGIYISINDQDQFIECDNIIVCAGQASLLMIRISLLNAITLLFVLDRSQIVHFLTRQIILNFACTWSGVLMRREN